MFEDPVDDEWVGDEGEEPACPLAEVRRDLSLHYDLKVEPTDDERAHLKGVDQCGTR